jgi:hypothetical protein
MVQKKKKKQQLLEIEDMQQLRTTLKTRWEVFFEFGV